MPRSPFLRGVHLPRTLMEGELVIRLLILLAVFGAASAKAQAPPTRRPCLPLTASMLHATITLAAPCYRFSGPVSVSGEVTIAPGTRIVAASGATLLIDQGASLTTLGTEEKPILFSGAEHLPGFWNGIEFRSNSSKNQFSYVTVEDAGATSDVRACVKISSHARLDRIDHTTLRNCAEAGLLTEDNAVLAGFANNHIEHTRTPLRIKPNDAGSIDAATTFSENKLNIVDLSQNEMVVKDDQTWHALAIPYHLVSPINISAHLTLEPGVVIEAAQQAAIIVDKDAALSARGTAANPIVFTGADKVPGFWTGITVNSAGAGTVFEHTRILYAADQRSGALDLSDRATLILRDSEIAFSNGVALWLRPESRINPDFATTNNLHDNKTNIKDERSH